MKTEPNNAMERSRLPVTHPAYAGCAPSNRLAHLERSAEINKSLVFERIASYSKISPE